MYPGYQKFSRGTLSWDVGEGRRPTDQPEAGNKRHSRERTSGKERLDLPCWMDLDPSNPIKIKFPVITWIKLNILVTKIPRNFRHRLKSELDSGLWILDSGLWTLDSGLWTLDSGLYIFSVYKNEKGWGGGGGWGLGGCSRYRIYVFPLISTTFLFFNFLTKTSEQHKGRLLVNVSFFVYFWRISSLTETSSGNEYN